MFYRKIYCDLIRRRTFTKEKLSLCRDITTNAREKGKIDLVSAAMVKYKINSVQDWTHLRQAILHHENNRGQYTKHNIDAMILGYCTSKRQFELGASYISYLNETDITPNLATVGKYLKLIYLKNYEKHLKSGSDCDEREEHLIFQYYKQIRREHPILDSFTLENVLLALSLTSRWMECLDLLKEIKISANPSGLAYSAVIASCFLHNEENLGWNLLEEMMSYEKVPSSVAFLAYLKLLGGITEKEAVMKRLEKLFILFQENQMKCSEDVAKSICTLGNLHSFQCDFSTVSYSGLCKNCYKKLEAFDLTDEEFALLRKKVLQNVIVGRDLFVRSNPMELERFKKFVSNLDKHDIVLDGLNVAYSIGTKQSPHVFASLVASVVAHFVQQKKKVLLLGRVHMKRWPHKHWGYVEQNATVFLTQDISQDDPYLLYCALSSGKDTIIVTRDLMRGHRFLLRDPKLKMLFNMWLSQRQYQLIRVDEKKGPIFRAPAPYNIVAQNAQGIWHIPYEINQDKNDEHHRNWLCVKC